MRVVAFIAVFSAVAALGIVARVSTVPNISAQAPTPTAPPGYSIERVAPSFQTVSLAQSTFSIDVTVEQATNLGGYEVLITFDSTAVSFISVSDGPFLGSTGRSVLCAPPLLEPLAGTQTKLHFGCGTVGSTPPNGPSGAGILSSVVFAPLASQVTSLALEPSLVDPLGEPQNAVAYGGQVEIAPGPTQTPTSTHSPTATSTPCPGGVCPTPTPLPCSPTTAEVNPPSLIGHPHVALDVIVSVAAVCDLGAFEFTLSFDPTLLEFVAFDLGSFLGSTGRSVACPAVALATSSVTVRCATLGAPPPAGASGSGLLATLRFVPRQTGSTALTLSGVTLLDPAATLIPSVSQGGSVSVVPCASCPTVTPTLTPPATPTIAPTNTHTPTFTSTPCAGTCPTAVLATPTSTPPMGPVTVLVDPPSQTPLEGTTLSADVRIDNVSNLGAFSILLEWEPGILSLNGATIGPFLGSTGRQSFCSLEASGSPGTARFSCGTLGASPPGPSGSGMLVTFDFVAIAVGSSSLSIGEAKLLAPNAAAIPVSSLVHGFVTVGSCGGSCPTATPTSQSTATPTPGAGGNAVVGGFPQDVDAVVGEFFDVDVNVSNVANLGAFEFAFQFATTAPSFLALSEVQVGPFLGSTGRPVVCQPPTVDAFTVRFACATSGTSAVGPSGNGTLATLTFHATAAGTTDLFGPSAVDLAGPLGDPIAVQLQGSGTVSVLPTGPTPTATNTAAAGAAAGPTQGWGVLATSKSIASSVWSGGDLSLLTGLLATSGIFALLFRPGGTRTRTRFWLGALGGSVVGAFLLVIVLSRPGSGVAAASSSIVVAEPQAENIFVGGPPVLLRQEASGLASTQQVSAFRLRLRYDPALVDVTFRAGALLGETGRSVDCTTTVVDHYEREFACSASGTQPFATGDGTLVEYELAISPSAVTEVRAHRSNGGLVPMQVDLEDVAIFDGAGQPIAIASVSSPIVFVRALEADVTKDCDVDGADLLAVGAAFPSAFGSSTFDDDLDLVPPGGDGIIGVSDVQFVLGRLGSSCEWPVPEQNPIATPSTDADNDGIADAPDNCPNRANPVQEDTDSDFLGDVCESDYGANPAFADTDGDGCWDGREGRPLAYLPRNGGDRDPGAIQGGWDFFDVPLPVGPAIAADGRARLASTASRNRVVTLADVSGVLANVGRTSAGAEYAADRNSDGIADGTQFDRSSSHIVGKPWRSGPSNGAISLSDVSVALAQVGHSCAAG